MARKLGRITGLPVIHIDPMYYKPGWVPREKSQTRALVLAASEADTWVFDGNHHSTFPQRLARADHLIFLDMPTWLRMWRVISRTMRHKGKTRPDMAEGCPERFDSYFVFKWVGGYYWRTRPTDLALMQNSPAHVTCVRLTSRREVKRFLCQAASVALD